MRKMTTTSGEFLCAFCGKVIHPHAPDDTFCSENCQINWTRAYWDLPSFAEEVRSGYPRFYPSTR
jgi:endogenous inhibitor of DNA gyrase (YacG/DUF329 family)